MSDISVANDLRHGDRVCVCVCAETEMAEMLMSPWELRRSRASLAHHLIKIAEVAMGVLRNRSEN